MTCAGDGSTGPRRSAWLFRDWARTRAFSVPAQVRPTRVEEVVAAVEEVEAAGGIVRALGSGWSYSDVALTPEVTHVVDTSGLMRDLGESGGGGAGPLLPGALADAWRARADRLVHIEAGIKIHDLNCVLHEKCLALPTMGGSNGQSLAGAIGTGTHGSDVDHPPIADSVRAVHLVGPGGQEWWIEPASNPITDPDRMVAARSDGRLCGDIRIEYDDGLFDAVLVSAGRMGVIYSVVLEAVDAFMLREERHVSSWEEEAPWVRSVVVGSGEPYGGPRFVEVVLSPYAGEDGRHRCVVTTRTVPDDPTPSGEKPGPDVFGLVCDVEPLTPVLAGLAALVPGLIAGATAAALAGLSWMLAIPFVGGALYAAASGAAVTAATSALVALEAALTAALAAPGENLGSKLAQLCNLASAAGQKAIVPRLIDAMLTAIRPPTPEPIVHESWRVMTGQAPCDQQWEDSPACMREIDGMELALDASPGSEDLFLFLEDIFALTREFYDAGRPPGLGLSLRFTKGTRALIGMQQFARTCSIEFIMLRGFAGHEEFRRRVYGIARRRGAIPHWGLIHEIDGSEVRRLYGDNLTDWRSALGRLIHEGGGRTGTFSTSFSVARDLEPLPGCVVPDGLVRLFRRILVGLARSRGMRAAAGGGGRGGGGGGGRDGGQGGGGGRGGSDGQGGSGAQGGGGARGKGGRQGG